MDSALVDVALGLTLLYLVLSLSVTSLNEVIASLLNLRGKMLYGKLKEVFGGQADEILKDPLLTALSKKKRPSYIPPRLFGEAVTSRIRDTVNTAVELKSRLDAGQLALKDFSSQLKKAGENAPLAGYAHRLIERAEGAGTTLLKNVEQRAAQHFDEIMDRLAGTFARRMKVVSMVIAIGLVTATNADTVRIANQLVVDDALRSSVADIAVEYTDPASDGNSNEQVEFTPNEMLSEQAAAAFPLGWECHDPAVEISWPNLACDPLNAVNLGRALLGWLLTALAIMLGAPFWFGVLGRVANIRGAGNKPKPTPKEPEPSV